VASADETRFIPVVRCLSEDDETSAFLARDSSYDERYRRECVRIARLRTPCLTAVSKWLSWGANLHHNGLDEG
jgi:hypothetical protein